MARGGSDGATSRLEISTTPSIGCATARCLASLLLGCARGGGVERRGRPRETRFGRQRRQWRWQRRRAVPAAAAVAPPPSTAARYDRAHTRYVTPQVRRTSGAGREQAGTHVRRYDAAHWRALSACWRAESRLRARGGHGNWWAVCGGGAAGGPNHRTRVRKRGSHGGGRRLAATTHAMVGAASMVVGVVVVVVWLWLRLWLLLWWFANNLFG